MSWRYALLLSLVLCCKTMADSVDDAIAAVRAQIAQATEQLNAQRAEITKQREGFQKQLSDLRQTIADHRNVVAKTRNHIQEQGTIRMDAEGQERQLKAGLDRSRRLLEEARKDLQSPVQHVAPTGDAFQAVDALLQDPKVPEFSIAEALLPIITNHIAASSTVGQFQAPVIKPDGTSITSSVYRAGGIAQFAIEGDMVAVVEPAATEKSYTLVSAQLPGAMVSSIKQASATNSGLIRIPIDVTGGRGLNRLGSRKGFVGFLRAGGPVVIPLLVIAALAIIMVIERFFYLLRVDKNVDRMLASVLPYLETADYDGALSTIGTSRGPVSNIVRSAVEHGRQRSDKLEELLQESILSELPTLERFLGALAVMAAAAPLLGLLGTVSGMIGTFEVISIYGTGNAKLLSGGISEALITTEIGLIIAVPILLAHAWLNRQVRTLVGHMDRAAISLASAIRQQSGGDES